MTRFRDAINPLSHGLNEALYVCKVDRLDCPDATQWRAHFNNDTVISFLRFCALTDLLVVGACEFFFIQRISFGRD